MFVIGEWVIRRFDGCRGQVREVAEYEGFTSYKVELSRHGSAEDNTFWGTEQAWESAFTLHAHVETSSADCDGTHSRGYVDVMDVSERCETFGDLSFKERIARSIISFTGRGTLNVNEYGVQWMEETEEGYRHVVATWCEKMCELQTWQRDHRAEEMGY